MILLAEFVYFFDFMNLYIYHFPPFVLMSPRLKDEKRITL